MPSRSDVLQFASLALLLWAVMANARADSRPGWMTDEVLKSLFPSALHTGPLTGEPPAAAVYGAGAQLGYVFATSDIVDTIGFSGAPFIIAVGLDMDGIMTGATLVEHAEPILDYKDTDGLLEKFFGQYLRLNYTGAARMSAGGRSGEIDGISGATISARAFHHAIIQSARSVARSRKLHLGDPLSASVDVLRFEPLDWTELVNSGAVQRLEIHTEKKGGARADGAIRETTEMYVALLNPASVGRNLLSRSVYQGYVASQSPRDLIIAVMSSGPYSFVGTKVFETGTFDRIQIMQGDARYPLIRQLGRYRYLPFLAVDVAPSFSEIGLFRLPAESGIDVLAQWDLVVSVHGDDSKSTSVAQYRLSYQLPERFVLPPVEPPAAPLEPSPVRSAWQAQAGNVAILVTALGVLTLVLTLMRALTRRPRLFQVVRSGFLVFTLVWLGWIAGAQLSVINPIGWAQALASGAGLTMLASDPLLAVLTAFVLASFVVWGRGVFCGWLCPFGALQELLAGIARRARLPQATLSHRLHRILWPLKYMVLGALVVAALHAPATLGLAAEVEPFKTVISLKFERSWPFVLYASVLLVVGLFVERAFCRFVCPLGALIAIGGRLRMRNPLERRAECGNPCQLCTRRCPVQAIAPSGQIDMDECFYCLDCQIIYHDERQCPPLVNRRKRATKAARSTPAASAT